MLKFLADENFNSKIVRGVLRLEPAIDIVRVQDTELVGSDDPGVLEWATQEGRVVLTHDVRTMLGFAYGRMRLGKPFAGLLEVRDTVSIRVAIEDIWLVATSSTPEEWENQVRYCPL